MPATVYAVGGGKHGLLRPLMDQWQNAPIIAATYEHISTLSDGDTILRATDYDRRNGRPYRYVYGVASGSEDDFLNRITKVDTETGSSVTWAEPGTHPGEPVFVPAPGTEREDAGVLLSVVLDPAAGTSFLLILDAASLGEIARARVPHHIPFGFHGTFFPSHVEAPWAGAGAQA